MHEFHRRVGIGKCLRFSYTYIKIAIEILQKLKSSIENAGMYCSTRGFAPRCCNTCTHFQCLTLTFQVFVYCKNQLFLILCRIKYFFTVLHCLCWKTKKISWHTYCQVRIYCCGVLNVNKGFWISRSLSVKSHGVDEMASHLLCTFWCWCFLAP